MQLSVLKVCFLIHSVFRQKKNNEMLVNDACKNTRRKFYCPFPEKIFVKDGQTVHTRTSTPFTRVQIPKQAVLVATLKTFEKSNKNAKNVVGQLFGGTGEKNVLQRKGKHNTT